MTDSNALDAHAPDQSVRFRLKDYGFVLALLLSLVLPMIALSTLASPAKQSWDMSLPWSLSEFHTQNAIRFADEVEKITQGRVKITVHPGAVLGIKGPDSLRAVENDVVAMAEMAGFQQIGSEPILGLEALPFLADDLDELERLYREFLRPSVEEAFERYDLKLLYIVPWPNQYLYAKEQLDTLSDARGLKVRTLDKNSTDLMERLGLTPIQMPSPDVVPALASGAIDAVITSATTGVAQKYWEFLTHAHATNHSWASNMMVVSGKAWRSLTKEDRRAIETLAKSLEPTFWDVSRDDDARQRAILAERGMVIVEPEEALLTAMRAQARPLWKEFVTAVPQARPVLDAYLSATGRGDLDAAEKAPQS